MSTKSGLQAVLVREQAKLIRQHDAVEATEAMIALIEAQLKAAK